MHRLKPRNTLRRQRGLASLEFAIVGLATLIILFMAMEMGRMMFTMNLLAEATRRGARVAAVCQPDEAYVSQITVFNSSGGNSSPFLRDLTVANVAIDYLGEDGLVTGTPASDTFYVRARIVNYIYNPIIPGFDLTFTAPEFATTIPAESMGYARLGQTSTCNAGV